MNSSRKQYVKLLTSVMYDVQAVRKAIDNRIDAFKREGGEDYEEAADELKQTLSLMAHKMEKEVERKVSNAVAKMPIIQWLER